MNEVLCKRYRYYRTRRKQTNDPRLYSLGIYGRELEKKPIHYYRAPSAKKSFKGFHAFFLPWHSIQSINTQSFYGKKITWNRNNDRAIRIKFSRIAEYVSISRALATDCWLFWWKHKIERNGNEGRNNCCNIIIRTDSNMIYIWHVEQCTKQSYERKIVRGIETSEKGWYVTYDSFALDSKLQVESERARMA